MSQLDFFTEQKKVYRISHDGVAPILMRPLLSLCNGVFYQATNNGIATFFLPVPLKCEYMYDGTLPHLIYIKFTRVCNYLLEVSVYDIGSSKDHY